MQCPVDHRPLTHIEYEGCVINTCQACGGELLSGDALAHIVQTREERFGAEFASLVEECQPLHGLVAAERDRSLVCPCCEGQMRPVNYAGDTAIFVDRCGSCGAVWLDQHELELVQNLLEKWADEAPTQLRSIADRLDEARRAAQQRTGEDVNNSHFAFINAVLGRVLDAA